MAYIPQPKGCWFLWFDEDAYTESVCIGGIATKPYTKATISINTYIRNTAPIGCDARLILTHRGKRYLIKQRDGNCMLVSKLY